MDDDEEEEEDHDEEDEDVADLTSDEEEEEEEEEDDDDDDESDHIPAHRRPRRRVMSGTVRYPDRSRTWAPHVDEYQDEDDLGYVRGSIHNLEVFAQVELALSDDEHYVALGVDPRTVGQGAGSLAASPRASSRDARHHPRGPASDLDVTQDDDAAYLTQTDDDHDHDDRGHEESATGRTGTVGMVDDEANIKTGGSTIWSGLSSSWAGFDPATILGKISEAMTGRLGGTPISEAATGGPGSGGSGSGLDFTTVGDDEPTAQGRTEAIASTLQAWRNKDLNAQSLASEFAKSLGMNLDQLKRVDEALRSTEAAAKAMDGLDLASTSTTTRVGEKETKTKTNMAEEKEMETPAETSAKAEATEATARPEEREVAAKGTNASTSTAVETQKAMDLVAEDYDPSLSSPLPPPSTLPIFPTPGSRMIPVAMYDPAAVYDEYEVIDLKVIHRKRSTGFEENKDFQVIMDDVVAGRYLVVDVLGSAAFSQAVQAMDLQTGQMICLKVIKNNKDYFDQSLDEIKLLKYVNNADPADEHGLLRLYDYFYFKEHLFIACELLKANLYEFQKYNRESQDPVYFTLPRLQSIAIQVLHSLSFLHQLNLIHSDLKPENILIKSYSKCQVKVIDLGSSCFTTDHLTSYVQSRSYRAPEVVLGLPYDAKIDIWSLGCIMAELSSGQVLFQNDGLATMLARIEGILRPIPKHMLEKARYAHRYYTRSGYIYDQDAESGEITLLRPKRCHLKHRVAHPDPLFVSFVESLLQVDPHLRPSASDALRHPFLAKPMGIETWP